MTEPQSFADLIGLWPSAAALATELKVKEVTARQWRLRRSIPGEYWQAIVSAAQERRDRGEEKFSIVSLDLLARLSADAAAGRERPTPQDRAVA